MRTLNVSDGFSSASQPTQGSTQQNAFASYASDAAFVTAKGSAAADGDVYYNTADDTVRAYIDGAWDEIAPIGNATVITAPAAGDKMSLADASDSDLTKAITLENAFKVIGSITEDASPVGADKVATYDASGTAAKGVYLPGLVASSGNLGKVFNGVVSCSVASSALTIALKTNAGTDPSSTDPVYAVFRNSTSATGTYVVRAITSALSLTVSSGSTLGHKDATEFRMYVYLVDNAGTVTMAVGSVYADPGTLQTTTAEGGAGGAGTLRTLYSASGHTSKAVAYLARLKSTQTTAGTWAAVPTEVAPAILDAGDFPNYFVHYATSGATSMVNSASTINDFASATSDVFGLVTTGASWAYTCPVDGKYRISCAIESASGGGWAAGEIWAVRLFIGGTATQFLHLNYQQATHSAATVAAGSITRTLSAGNTIACGVFQNSGAALNSGTNGEATFITIEYVGP